MGRNKKKKRDGDDRRPRLVLSFDEEKRRWVPRLERISLGPPARAGAGASPGGLRSRRGPFRPRPLGVARGSPSTSPSPAEWKRPRSAPTPGEWNRPPRPPVVRSAPQLAPLLRCGRPKGRGWGPGAKASTSRAGAAPHAVDSAVVDE